MLFFIFATYKCVEQKIKIHNFDNSYKQIGLSNKNADDHIYYEFMITYSMLNIISKNKKIYKSDAVGSEDFFREINSVLISEIIKKKELLKKVNYENFSEKFISFLNSEEFIYTFLMRKWNSLDVESQKDPLVFFIRRFYDSFNKEDTHQVVTSPYQNINSNIINSKHKKEPLTLSKIADFVLFIALSSIEKIQNNININTESICLEIIKVQTNKIDCVEKTIENIRKAENEEIHIVNFFHIFFDIIRLLLKKNSETELNTVKLHFSNYLRYIYLISLSKPEKSNLYCLITFNIIFFSGVETKYYKLFGVPNHKVFLIHSYLDIIENSIDKFKDKYTSENIENKSIENIIKTEVDSTLLLCLNIKSKRDINFYHSAYATSRNNDTNGVVVMVDSEEESYSSSNIFKPFFCNTNNETREVTANSNNQTGMVYNIDNNRDCSSGFDLLCALCLTYVEE